VAWSVLLGDSLVGNAEHKLVLVSAESEVIDVPVLIYVDCHSVVVVVDSLGFEAGIRMDMEVNWVILELSSGINSQASSILEWDNVSFSEVKLECISL